MLCIAAPEIVWYKDPSWISTIATVVYVFCTILYLVATWKILNATRNNTRLTKEIFEATNRPYVGISETHKITYDGSPDIVFAVHYKNVGAVPAYDVRIEDRILVDDRELPYNSEKDSEVGMLVPQSERTATNEYHDKKNIDAINNTSDLKIRFVCKYKGIAGKEFQYTYLGKLDNSRQIFYAINEQEIEITERMA